MLRKGMLKLLLILFVFSYIFVTLYSSIKIETITAEKIEINKKIKLRKIINIITNPVGAALNYMLQKYKGASPEEVERARNSWIEQLRRIALLQRSGTLPKLEIDKMRKEPSIPILFADMKAITWEKGVEKEVENPQTNPDKWYDYYAGRMANAKTKDGSYWVWIPRFAYRITYYTDASQTNIKGYYTDKGFVLSDMKTMADESAVKTPYQKMEKEFVPNYETIKSQGFRIHEAFRKRWNK